MGQGAGRAASSDLCIQPVIKLCHVMADMERERAARGVNCSFMNRGEWLNWSLGPSRLRYLSVGPVRMNLSTPFAHLPRCLARSRGGGGLYAT